MAPVAAEKRRHLLEMCFAEFVGTALLVTVGLSIVIFDEGRGSPLAGLLPSVAARRALTGGLFGATGMTIALSPVGRISGAHINPVVSLAFWFEKTLSTRALVAFISSQLVGATAGAVPLLLWGDMGRAIGYGATTVGPRGVGTAFLGEMITTFVLVLSLLCFVGHRRLRSYTPGIFPPMYCVMVWLEAPWSGTSTNPARSLGPDVIALAVNHYWLYWAAPVAGTLLALLARRFLPVLRDLEVDIARVSHFDVILVEERASRTRHPPRRVGAHRWRHQRHGKTPEIVVVTHSDNGEETTPTGDARPAPPSPIVVVNSYGSGPPRAACFRPAIGRDLRCTLPGWRAAWAC
jgi:aquaporin Z